MPASRLAISAGYASSNAFCVRASDWICCVRLVEVGRELRVLELDALELGVLRHAAAGEADADEDPDDERDEDGRQRGDVIAEVEHALQVCRGLAEPVEPDERLLRAASV